MVVIFFTHLRDLARTGPALGRYTNNFLVASLLIECCLPGILPSEKRQYTPGHSLLMLRINSPCLSGRALGGGVRRGNSSGSKVENAVVADEMDTRFGSDRARARAKMGHEIHRADGRNRQ